MLPYLGRMFVVTLVITCVPWIVRVVPRFLGF